MRAWPSQVQEMLSAFVLTQSSVSVYVFVRRARRRRCYSPNDLSTSITVDLRFRKCSTRGALTTTGWLQTESESITINCHVRLSPTSFSYEVLQQLLLTFVSQLAKIAAHPKELGRFGVG